jgi:hypothetical protein
MELNQTEWEHAGKQTYVMFRDKTLSTPLSVRKQQQCYNSLRKGNKSNRSTILIGLKFDKKTAKRNETKVRSNI